MGCLPMEAMLLVQTLVLAALLKSRSKGNQGRKDHEEAQMLRSHRSVLRGSVSTPVMEVGIVFVSVIDVAALPKFKSSEPNCGMESL